ncbi:hypothetical protein CNR22_00160 [Sphingobacteriaceae bacterium]|nr:hypothetical protein CNR22_00160 [Sphingobacteriaceae bacterium]
MKVSLAHKVKGSSIVEVLIALAITSFCASLAIIIYLNIQKSSLPFFKVKAVELANFYMKETQIKQSFTDESFSAEEFTVKKTITTSEMFPDCSLVRIIVYDGTKKKIMELENVIKQK